MATTTTLRTLLERIAEGLWPGHFPVKITAVSNADKAVFEATTAAWTSGSVNDYDGVYIYILYDAGAAGGAPEGELVRVTSGGFTIADGTFAVSPEFTVAPTTGDIGLFLYGLHVDELIDGINDIQRTLTLPRYLIASAINDGDMEGASADVTTDWPDVTGTPTQTKDTTEVLTGTQSLKVVTTVLDTSVGSKSLPVTEDESLLLSVPVKCTAGSLRVQLYDATSGAEIEGATVDEEAWTEVRFTESVPDDCQNVQVRFIAKTAATTAYVDSVSLLPTSRGLLSLPSQLADATDLLDVMYLPAGLASEADYSYVALSKELVHWPWDGHLRDMEGVTSHRTSVGTPISHPLFLKFRSAGTALSALTSTTYAPEELVVTGALSILNGKLGILNRDGGRLEKADRQRKAYHSMLDGLGLARPTPTRPAQRRVSA